MMSSDAPAINRSVVGDSHAQNQDALREILSSNRPVLTVDETAIVLGISRGLAFEAVHRGELPSVRVGRRILIPRSRLMAMLDGSGAP